MPTTKVICCAFLICIFTIGCAPLSTFHEKTARLKFICAQIEATQNLSPVDVHRACWRETLKEFPEHASQIKHMMYKLDIIEAKMKQGQDVSQDAREYDNMFKNLYEYARLHAEREQVQQQVQQQLLMQFILSGANNPVPIPNINMPQQRQPVCRTVNYSGKMVTQCE